MKLRTCVIASGFCLSVFATGEGRAHELSVTSLDVEFVSPTDALIVFSSSTQRRATSSLPVNFQDSCQLTKAPWLKNKMAAGVQQKNYSLQCSESHRLMLQRESRFLGSASNIIYRVEWLNGEVTRGLLSQSRPRAELGILTESEENRANFFVMGALHLLKGYDHIAFLLGLFLLIGIRRKLLWLVTAFTVGHALSLVALVSFKVDVPTRLVETFIALSVVLLALEVRHRTKLSVGTEVWSLGFGVLHGMGFSSAVRELGHDIYWAELLNFNLGIEAAQIAVVSLFLVLVRIGSGLKIRNLFRSERLVFVLGSVGCFALLKIWF
ncbi:MAG: HupE/UreJ family protein [Myxococcota bacterium]|nr:HupE/UreJ family protein [Myxococcota bacterium]